MAEKRLTHTITVDLAKETWSSRPVLVQNSDNTFLITVLNDGEPADLSDVRDIVLAVIPSRKKANDSVYSPGVKVGSTSQVKIDLGRAAVATPGIVQAQLKLTGTNGGLISSTSFNFEVQMDAGLNFQPSENELTLIETVLGDGPTVLANATQTIADMESTQATLTGAVGGAISSLNEDKATAIEELAEVREANRFRQLDAVATVADRDSAYPSPEHGDTVRVTSDATMYKYDKDAGWVVSDRYEATAVDALNRQLAETDGKKANREEVIAGLEQKRDKSVPISLNDADAEFLAAVQGGEETTFNLLSEPRDNSVTMAKIAPETKGELKNLSFTGSMEIENSLSQKFNLFADKEFKLTNTKLTESTDVSGLVLKGKIPTIYEVTVGPVETEVNSFVSVQRHEIPHNRSYHVGIWYNLAELQELLGADRRFNCYLIAYNAAGGSVASAGTSSNEGLTSAEVGTIGSTFSTSGSQGTTKLEVVTIENGWVHIRYSFSILVEDAVTVTTFFCRIARSIIPVAKTIHMTEPVCSDIPLNPYLMPYANKDEYEESKRKLETAEEVIQEVNALSSNVNELSDSVSELSGKVEEVEANRSKWHGKKLMVFGDSNSANNSVTVWHQQLKEELNMTVYNYARGGAGYIAKSTTGIPPNIKEQIEMATEDPDLIIIFAGGNDYSLAYPLGTPDDTGMDTFYGALHNAYTDVINKFPTKQIAVIVQTRRSKEGSNSSGVSVKDQADATLEMSGRFSLPALDMYHRGGMHPWNSTFKDLYVYDGVHLSTLGHERLKEKVKAFINTL